MNRFSVLAFTLVGASWLFLTAPVPANALTLPWHFVSATEGSDAGNDCTDQYAPCATIQHAIDESSPGDSVTVKAGTYAEEVKINKPLRLSGPNGELQSRGAEALIDGGAGTALLPEAKNIEIKGFSISTTGSGMPIHTSGSDVDGLTVSDNIIKSNGAGVQLDAGGEKTRVNFNIIEADEYGIRLNGPLYTDLEIRWNRFPGSPGSYGVFAGYGTAISDFLMEGNEMQAPSRISARVTEGQVVGNVVDVGSSGIGLQINTDESRLSENTFEGHGSAPCLKLLGSEEGLDPSVDSQVGDNRFHACNPYGIELGPNVNAIRIGANEFPGSYDGITTSDAVPWNVTGRVIVDHNRIVGTTHLGVHNSVAGMLDANWNWWGCNVGPGAQGCDGASAGVDASATVTLGALIGPREPETGIIKLPSGNSITLNPGEDAELVAVLVAHGTVAQWVPTEGLNVGFSSPFGTLWRATNSFTNGQSWNFFTAGPTPGPGWIAVTMDNERILVPVRITGPSPSNSSPPSISGNATEGGTLTESHGSWTDNPTSYRYQWQRCDPSGNSCSAISGATAQTYVLTQEDVGDTIRVQESATNISGGSDPAISAPTSVVRGLQQAFGAARVGRAKVSRLSAKVPIKCTGPSEARCKITLVMRVTMALKAPKLVAHNVNARRTPDRVATVGRKTVTLGAGDRRSVRIKLNGAGKRLLASHGALHAILEVVQLANNTTTRMSKQTVTFTVFRKNR